MCKRSASAVWKYFTMFQDRLEICKCNNCSQEIRREPVGTTSKKISTKSLWGHLKSKHKNEHSLAEKEWSKETDNRENFKKARRKILIFLYFVRIFFYYLIDCTEIFRVYAFFPKVLS